MKLTKTIILMVLLLGIFVGIEAQTKKGSTDTPYSTEGWDAPADSTAWYKLFIYRLLSNPGGYINLNTAKIDSLLNALVVLLDTTQHNIVNDTLRNSPYSMGQDAFAGTAQTDTVLVNGLDSMDTFLVTIREATPTANDLLGVKLINNKAIIQRPSSGTSGLKYNWYWRRRY